MIRVRIPATTANLGPGFDCMGLALDLWNTFELYTGPQSGISERGGKAVQAGKYTPPEPVEVETHGEGAGVLPTDAANLVAATLIGELNAENARVPSRIKIVVHNTIPCASGLGSSSTATLAGLLFAQAIQLQRRGEDPAAIDMNFVLERAVAIEGHGDNVAPALIGGFVIVVPDSSGVLTQRIPHLPIKTVVCVPEFAYLTTEARSALPQSYTKADSIFNIGRAMLVAEALRVGDDALLAKAMNDRIHEPYRLPAIPGAAAAKLAAIDSGAICVSLSGAGPGVIAFARKGFDRIGRSMKYAFEQAGLTARYWILDATDQGVHIGQLPV